MLSLHDVLQTQYLGNTVLNWLLAAIAFGVTLGILPMARSYVLSHRRQWKDAHMPAGVELMGLLVSRTSKWFLFILGLYFVERLLTLPAAFDRIAQVVIVISFWLQVGIWATTAVRYWLDRELRKTGEHDAAKAGSFEVVLFIARLAIFAFVLMIALDNLGVQIKPLLAGLGIGGIAVALAVQNVLGDVFASLSITLDKPFEIGDSLAIDDTRGTVERIGIKSTRLRSLDGEQIIISNAELLKSRVRNYKRMYERRQAFKIAVPYETPAELLPQIPKLIEAAIREHPKARFDRSHLMSLGESALVYETVYFITEPDYGLFADIQQAINLRLIAEFGQRGIEFAYPTQRQISDPSAPASTSAPDRG